MKLKIQEKKRSNFYHLGKKLLFGLIAIVMLSSSAFAQDTPPKEEDPPFFQFEFGRKSMNCGGFGICVFKFTITQSVVKDLVSAVLIPGGLFKVSMPAAFYKANARAFKDSYLIVDEDYVIDRETTRKIGLKDGYTIKKGKYMVVFDKKTNTYNCTF